LSAEDADMTMKLDIYAVLTDTSVRLDRHAALLA
jgi:hypothetical protein